MPTDEVTEPLDRKSHLIDLTPLRASPAFARLWLGNSIAGIGAQMTIVAVGLHIFDLTGSTFAVSLVGVFALVPTILAGLYGGMLVDSFDRRLVALVSAIAAWCSVGGLALLAWTHVETVWPYYLLTTTNAAAATIIMTSRQAILPRLLPNELLPAAAALTGVTTGIMITLGPALAGFLVAFAGFEWTYSTDFVLFAAAFLGILSLPSIIPEGERTRPGLGQLREGMRFLRHAPNVRLSFIVDIIAMTFGNPRVLFPAVGALVIGGGAISVGILTAAGAIGAFLSSIVSGRAGRVRRQGQAIGWSIIAYGACILGFGTLLAVLVISHPVDSETVARLLSADGEAFRDLNVSALVVGFVLLAGAGAADNISAIFRNTVLQAAVPDGMRGRIQGVFIVVVTGGPRIGDAYIGIVAAITALWVAPLLGGVLIILLLAIILRTQRGFREYDALNPTP